MQRRRQRDKECEQAGLEGDQAPDGVAPRQPAMKVPPAAPVDAASQQQRNDDPGIERPRLKYAGYNRIGEVFFYFKLWSVAHDFKRWNGGIMEYWIGRLESEYSDTPFFLSLFHHSIFPTFHYLAAESRAAGTFAGRKVCMKATRAVTSSGARFLPKAGMLPPP